MQRAFPLLLMAVLAGCTVGPDFERPAAPVVSAYRPALEVRATAPAEPQPALGEGPAREWWTAFGSPELDALVRRALRHNNSLAASNATLAAMMEQVRAAAGRALPQVDATARADQQQINLAAMGFSGLPGVGNLANPEFHLYSVGAGVFYDLDPFGGVRRQVEQTVASAEAQQRQTEAAHLAVAGQVVNQVLAIAALRAQIATAEALLADDQRNIDLTQKRHEAGEGTLLDVLNARAQYMADRGAIPQLRQQVDEARHLLAILVAVAPAELGPTEFDLDRLTLPAAVPVTLPSALVHKRPDILQAEANLHAATAAIGVATARLYPDITLGASISQASSDAGNLAKDAFRGYDIFAAISAPIFHGGTLKAERRAAVHRAHAAAATYQQTVLTAFGQVADLLSALQSDARSVANQREAVAVADQSLRLARRSFAVGNTGILQVLDAERLFQRATSDLMTARTRQILNVGRLYVATAGGWTEPAPVTAAAASGAASGS